jgi:drug/metabolite transporter (DMT)-like permease
LKSPFPHEWLWHTDFAVLQACVLSAALFGVGAIILTAIAERTLQIWHAATQAGNGAMFPIFFLLPFVPFDHDLAEALYAEPLPVIFAGIFAMGASIYIFFRTTTHYRDPYAPPPFTKRSANNEPKDGKPKKPSPTTPPEEPETH